MRLRVLVPSALAALALCAGAATALQFTDATTQAGVAFRTAGEVHGPANWTWPAFPEIMGAGACFADFNGDGLNDLFIANQVYNRENPNVPAWVDSVDPRSKLYVNAGDGTFEDLSQFAGLSLKGFYYGCSAADYDGDSDVDLLATGFGVRSLFENVGGGRFVNVTARSGIGAPTCPDYDCMGSSSAWADYDNDGDLDVYVGNYVETNYTDLIRGPRAHVGQENFLFRNEGNGRFSEVARFAGVQGERKDEWGSKTLGVIWFDVELDGDLDLYVANDETPNDFYLNLGNGRFVERTNETGLSDPRASMGITAGDYDRDGYPDLFFTHYAFEQNGFYRNRGDGTFQDRSGEDALADSFVNVGWGTTFVDADRDGWLDIMLVNGHTEYNAFDYQQASQLFYNRPNGTPGAEPWNRNWTAGSQATGLLALAQKVGRGAAWADFDYDGDTDYVQIPNNNETAQLVRASGVTNKWLTITLKQPGMNRFAIGARVVLESANGVQTREVQAGSSYLSQNALDLEFGLGSAAKADRVTVHWPGGGQTVVTDVAANQVVRIERATGAVVADTIAPLTRAQVAGQAGSDGWFRSPVTATLRSEDRGVTVVSGVASTSYSTDGGATWRPGTGDFSFGEGRHVLLARSVDHAGNLEQGRPVEVRVDLTPPTASHALDGTRGESGWWVAEPVTVTLAGEDALSGVASIRYRVDGGAWTTYGAPFNLDTDGVRVVEYRATDLAGNEGALERVVVKLDRVAPTGTIRSPDLGQLWWGDTLVLDAITGPAFLVATDETPAGGGSEFGVLASSSDATSGPARVEILVNGEIRATVPAAPYAWTWNTSLEPSGSYILSIAAFDVAGNRGTASTRVVLVGASESSLAATAEEGPSTRTGLPLVDGLAGAKAMPVPVIGLLAGVRWLRRSR